MRYERLVRGRKLHQVEVTVGLSYQKPISAQEKHAEDLRLIDSDLADTLPRRNLEQKNDAFGAGDSQLAIIL